MAVSARTVRRIAAGMASGAVLVGVGLAYAHDSDATPAAAGCVQQSWWYGSKARMTTRTICDGVLRQDGSWDRSREFYAPASWVPVTCSWGRYGGGFCTGGYWLPVFEVRETYPVTPDTVLADEPGHLA